MVLYVILTPGEVVAAAVVFPLVGAVVVGLRIRRQLKVARQLHREDWLVLPALAFMIGMGIASIYGVAVKSEGYLSPKDPTQAEHLYVIDEQISWNTEWMQPLALGCIKLSFLFFYRRLFNYGSSGSVFNVFSLAVIGIVVVWMFGFCLGVILICPTHPSWYWNPTLRAEHCWNTHNFQYAFCWSDVATDLIILAIPIYPISRLHMTLQRKFAVLGAFALGGVAVAASIVRAVFYVQLLTAEITEIETLDFDMVDSNGIYWMLVETGLALIAVNLPLLYGSFIHEGIDSILRAVRSFTSVHTSSGRRGDSLPEAPAIPKQSDESDGLDRDFEMVAKPTHHTAAFEAPAVEYPTPAQLEAGSINVTKSVTVHEARRESKHAGD